MKYVIIGNGVAGIEAAFTIRENDQDSEITIITRSLHLFYYRPRLIEYLRGKMEHDELIIHPGQYYQERRIENILGTGIAKIDPSTKQVISSDGRRFSYDRLLIATGSNAYIPPVEGSDLSGVFSLRHLGDARNILSYSLDSENVVIVGGGLLGLEVANSMRIAGKKVTVIEYSGRLLPRQLDENGAHLLMTLLTTNRDMSFILPDSVVRILGDDGIVTGLSLGSGKEIPADMVIFTTGVRPSIEIAQDCKVKANRGIIVDRHMQTSIRNIFCAGDAAEFQGTVHGIWPVAKTMGRIAALNMMGTSEEYTGMHSSTVLKIPGIQLYSAGRVDTTGCEVLTTSNEDSYLRLLLDQGKPAGVIVIGNPRAMVAALRVFDGTSSLDILMEFF